MNKENLKTALEMEIKKFEIDTMADNSIDTKSSIFLGLVVTILIGFITIKSEMLSITLSLYPYTIFLITFLLLMGISFFVYIILPKDYQSISIDLKTTESIIGMEEVGYLMQSISNCNGARMKNKEILNKKLFAFKLGLIFCGIGLFLLVNTGACYN